jgi:hypothetical protein
MVKYGNPAKKYQNGSTGRKNPKRNIGPVLEITHPPLNEKE